MEVVNIYIFSNCALCLSMFILTLGYCFLHYLELMKYSFRSLALLILGWASRRWCAFEMITNTRYYRIHPWCNKDFVCRCGVYFHDRRRTKNVLRTNKMQ